MKKKESVDILKEQALSFHKKKTGGKNSSCFKQEDRNRARLIFSLQSGGGFSLSGNCSKSRKNF